MGRRVAAVIGWTMSAEHRLADQMLRSTRFALLVVAAIVLAARSGGASLPAAVRIETGLVAGVTGSTADVRVFKGIPFAAPPVGPLRWRPPQPAGNWAGIRPADQYGAPCMQPTVTRGGRPGGSAPETSPSEDCLYLNVWTAAASTSERRPVIVWSHGGAFTIGSGSGRDGDALARKGVVVVAHLAATRIV
jgi:para-nitrobenzyl esterase